MQWRKWLPKTGGGGAFYSAKKWVGQFPPLPPFTDASVESIYAPGKIKSEQPNYIIKYNNMYQF